MSLIFVPSLGSHPRFITDGATAALKADRCIGFLVATGYPGTRVVERLRDPARSDEWAIGQAEYHLRLKEQGTAPDYWAAARH